MKPYIGVDCVNLVKSFLQEHSLTKHLRKNANFQIMWSKPYNRYTRQIRVNCINGVACISFNKWLNPMENLEKRQFYFFIFESTQTEWSELDDDFFGFFGKVPIVPRLPTDMGVYGFVLVN